MFHEACIRSDWGQDVRKKSGSSLLSSCGRLGNKRNMFCVVWLRWWDLWRVMSTPNTLFLLFVFVVVITVDVKFENKFGEFLLLPCLCLLTLMLCDLIHGFRLIHCFAWKIVISCNSVHPFITYRGFPTRMVYLYYVVMLEIHHSGVEPSICKI